MPKMKVYDEYRLNRIVNSVEYSLGRKERASLRIGEMIYSIESTSTMGIDDSRADEGVIYPDRRFS